MSYKIHTHTHTHTHAHAHARTHTKDTHIRDVNPTLQPSCDAIWIMSPLRVSRNPPRPFIVLTICEL